MSIAESKHLAKQMIPWLVVENSVCWQHCSLYLETTEAGLPPDPIAEVKLRIKRRALSTRRGSASMRIEQPSCRSLDDIGINAKKGTEKHIFPAVLL